MEKYGHQDSRLFEKCPKKNGMTNIHFVDLNADLCEAVFELAIPVAHADYFQYANKVDRPVLVTASNPHFSMGGGIDALFAKHYPLIVQHKQAKGGEMERIQNIVFTVTVGNHFQATEQLVEKAIRFAIENTHNGETLLLSGLGTGIGGLSQKQFVEIMKKVCYPQENI